MKEIEEIRNQVLEEMNAHRIDGKTYIDSDWLLGKYETKYETLLRISFLRSEIEKLENVIRDFIARWEHPDSELPIEHTIKSETIYHLTSIITRYKEELKVLESK